MVIGTFLLFILFLLTVYTGSVLDEQAKEDALVDILNLRHLGDTTILGSFLDVVLLAL